MTEWYTPPHVTQRTGSKCQFSNCWCAVGAWLHRGATGGTASVTPEEFRVAAGGGSGRPNATTGCNSGFEIDMIKGLDKLGVRGVLLKVTPAIALKLLTTDRRAIFGIAVDYDAWPAEKDCMNGVAGPDVNHMVGFIGGKPLKMVMNPLCTDYQAVSALAVLKAAEKFSKQAGRTTVWITRVARPIPVGLPEAEAQIADLISQVNDRDDAIKQALDLINQAEAALEPYKE
jgi:hypothetical protein